MLMDSQNPDIQRLLGKILVFVSDIQRLLGKILVFVLANKRDVLLHNQSICIQGADFKNNQSTKQLNKFI